MIKDLPKITQTISVAGTTYTDILELADVGAVIIEALLKVTALTGADTTLTIIPQFGFNKTELFDQDTDDQFTAVNSSTSLPSTQKLQLGFGAQYCRFKIVVAGANPSVTFDLYAVAKPGSKSSGFRISNLPSLDSSGADARSNTKSLLPSSSRIEGFNGSTWDRIRSGLVSITATLTGWLNTITYAIYNASPTTRTEGQGGPLQTDAKGNLLVTLNTLSTGENQSANRVMISMPGTPTRVTTATTTVARSGTGVLKRLVVKAALTGTITIYDNTAGSGTIIDVLPIGFPAGSYELNYSFNTGCTLVSSAADNFTPVIEPN